MSAYNKDGLHYIYCQLFSAAEALDYFNRLEKEITYLSGECTNIKLYGKSVPIPRQHVAFGDEHLKYTFSGLTLHPKPWTPLLMEIKRAVEQQCGTNFNFVLINKYRNGYDSIGYHRDDESDLQPDSIIASVSLGQKRDFVFKRNEFESVNLSLESGSLLQMLPPTNSFWSHSLPKSKHAPNVRLNLTFRSMRSSGETCVKSSVSRLSPSRSMRHHVIASHQPIDKRSDKNFPALPVSLPASLLSSTSLVASAASINMKRSADSNSTSTKRMCTSPQDSGLVVKPTAGIPLGNLPPHHFSLGGNKLVKVVEFAGSIKVHIRSYHFDGQLLHPTKYGITMSPLAFIRFMKRIQQISLTNAVHDINKELSVDCSSSPDGSIYCFQKYYFRENGIRQLSATYVSLNREQFQVLSDTRDQIWNSVTQLLFGSIFQKTVHRLKETVPIAQRTHDTNRDELMSILVRVVQELVQENIQHVFTCPECNLPHDMMILNQLGHTCAFYTTEEKFVMHFEEAIAFLDPKTVAKAFVGESGDAFISNEFLNTLDVKTLLETAKDIPMLQE